MNSKQNEKQMEIEKKFLIKFPDIDYLNTLCFAKSDIIQTYLKKSDPEASSRVRRRNTRGQVEYTKTEKRRVSDMTRIEYEDIISAEEYNNLLNSADTGLKTIEKTRWCIKYNKLVLEVDVFPFWTDRAILEIELESEAQEFDIPDYIDVIKDVTSDRRYTNRALAKEVPYDDIL